MLNSRSGQDVKDSAAQAADAEIQVVEVAVEKTV